jgi:hypothetical protein
MIKIISTALVFLTTFILCAQENTTKLSVYISAGLSISNTRGANFSYSSYPSIEAGIMKKNASLGLVLGRNNLDSLDSDRISNYWYEVKGALYLPLGNYNGYALLGIGNYMNTSQFFIEYGLGCSYAWKHFGVFAQASNWDGTWYATPGISYTF